MACSFASYIILNKECYPAVSGFYKNIPKKMAKKFHLIENICYFCTRFSPQGLEKTNSRMVCTSRNSQ